MESITREDFDKQRDPTSIHKLVCSGCKKKFYIRRWYHNYLIKHNKGRGFFCSRRCAQTKRPVSEETREKIRASQIGIPRPQSGLSNEKHPNWKGDNVGIKALHYWVKRHLPQPKLCEFCNVNKSRDLANITGVYNRKFKNWKYLCPSCHKTYDYENGFRKYPSEETKQKIRLGNLRYRLRLRKRSTKIQS
jgi:hypothetical protein